MVCERAKKTKISCRRVEALVRFETSADVRIKRPLSWVGLTAAGDRYIR